MNHSFKRRRFIKDALAGSIAATSLWAIDSVAPDVLCQAAMAARSDHNVLVVVEMAGGNDGLNTIVPHSHDEYKKSRPKLAIAKADVLSIDGELGMHPSMTGFAQLLERGAFAVVQGVGYPDPNRSHFESMDIWHSCRRKTESRENGWLGRYLESARDAAGGDPPAIHFGSEKQPFALMSRDVRVPSIQSLAQFRLRGNDSVDLPETLESLSQADAADPSDLLGFIQTSTSSAIAASKRMESSRGGSKTAETFPQTGLGQKLGTVAELIASGIQSHVYYVRIDGFDTHANQPDAHTALLREVSDAVTAFTNEMIAQGNGERVLTMCFSEFGRRVAENASDGTDHGTAGPIFFAGQRVRSGTIGHLPSLTDLDNGDLKFHTDFRQVYATVLRQWLQCDPQPILGGKYAKIELFS
ncbi:DUF1501 domain-containing protein [Stieleria varia]|uniref:DUF1501 domain-containing protein n=1 Tax=Stieleria varia TaxID=2528005 RepID=A0A5C6AQI0_9BACT|nr:DUF1501 domain-containing protein [Stieleria varia]TWU01326.1 hypothetical protein Pla52n_47000 [Stieleria varia]